MKFLSFDQATNITGYVIYDNQSLQRFGIIKSKGDTKNERIKSMYAQVLQLISDEHPDFVSIEGVQYQNNFQVYSTLSQMQGVFFAIFYSLGIEFMIVEPTVWKSFCGVKGRARDEQKQSAMSIVHDDGITASEDECEAILQGRYVLSALEKGTNNETKRTRKASKTKRRKNLCNNRGQ